MPIYTAASDLPTLRIEVVSVERGAIKMVSRLACGVSRAKGRPIGPHLICRFAGLRDTRRHQLVEVRITGIIIGRSARGRT